MRIYVLLPLYIHIYIYIYGGDKNNNEADGAAFIVEEILGIFFENLRRQTNMDVRNKVHISLSSYVHISLFS